MTLNSRDTGDFERQTRAMLEESAQRLPASVRSRLTQARHAAVAARGTHRPILGLSVWGRSWVPAVAMASLFLAVVLVVIPRVNAPTPGDKVALEDIELLSDSEVALEDKPGGQEASFDFYEWAGNENQDATPAVGS